MSAVEKLQAKRRRAVLLARDLQKRLYAEHAMVDRANEKRRHAAERANVAEVLLDKLQRDMAEMAATLQQSATDLESQRQHAGVLADELEAARRSPTYFDTEGREKIDLIGRNVYHARLALDRAERAETALAASETRCQRLQRAINDMADKFEAMAIRVARAEAAARASVA